MLLRQCKRPRLFFYFSLSAILMTTLFQVHVRIQSTIVGYELGRLKSEEKRLLEQRGNLKMELAKLTTKRNLSLFAESDDQLESPIGSVAAH